MARLLVFPKRLPPTTTVMPPNCDKQDLNVDHNVLSPITRLRTQSYAILGTESANPIVPDSLPEQHRFNKGDNRVEIVWNDDLQEDLNGREFGSFDEDMYSSQELLGNREWKRSLGPQANDDAPSTARSVNVPVSLVEYDTVEEDALRDAFNPALSPRSPQIGISLFHTITSTDVYSGDSLLRPLSPFGNSTFIEGIGLGMGSLSGTAFSTTTCAPTGEWSLLESPIRVGLLVLLSLFNAYIVLGNVLVLLGIFLTTTTMSSCNFNLITLLLQLSY